MIGFRAANARAQARAWRSLVLAGMGAAALGLAGCGPSTVGPPADAAPRREDMDFIEPPRVFAASRTAGGAVSLNGSARPRAEVRLASPGGPVLSATADAQGVWRIVSPSLSEAALFGLSTRASGRVVQAEGYVALLPSPGPPAALLRAGSGAALFAGREGPLSVQAVDIDAAGAAVVSGRSPGKVLVSAIIDGAPAGEGGGVNRGGYQLALRSALSPGVRRIGVQGGGETAEIELDIAPPRAPEARPWRSERLDHAWRIDWVTPGMGLQTSFIIDEGAGG